MTSTTPISLQIILALLASGPGIIAIILQIRKNRQEAAAERDRLELDKEKQKAVERTGSVQDANQVTQAAINLVAVLTARVDEIEKDMGDLRNIVSVQNETIRKQEETIHDLNDIVRRLTNGVRRLIKQLVDSGLDPCWKPDEEDDIL